MATVREFVAQQRTAGKINRDQENSIIAFLEDAHHIHPEGEICENRKVLVTSLVTWIHACGLSPAGQAKAQGDPVQTEKAEI